MKVRALLGRWLALGCIAGLPGCGTPPGPPPAPASAPAPTPVFFEAKLAELDAAIEDAIARTNCPGAVLWIERLGTAYHRAYGHRAVLPAVEPMTEDTVFDAASLTKVIACAPAVMLLVERGQVALDTPLHRYLPEFRGDGREAVTVRHLLTHTSGLRPDISLKPDWSGRDAALKLCFAEKLTAPPGERFIYSDTGPILLGELVRRQTGRDLDAFLAAEVFGPLRMVDTGFNPPRDKWSRVAPTEVENGTPLRGLVHDPRARRMGGVAGHAGLFTTAADLARFCRMMLNEGELDGVRVFRPETVRLMTSVQTPPGVTARRGLGWDVDSGYAGQRGEVFPIGGYGHTGWTGTSLWVDPFSRTFVILLTNRNHPTEDGNVIPLRRTVGTLAAQAVVGFNFSFVPGALPPRTNAPAGPRPPARAGGASERPAPPTTAVLNGIDALARQNFAPLRGLRVGLITNHTGHDRERRSTADLLTRAPGVTLVALFSPEHGLRGALDEKVGDSTDGTTGLPVFSLYGDTRQPKPEQLQNLDALVFDIQDIGARFYTYISTLGLAMEAAARAGKRFFVLDRVNPIGGVAIEGPVHTGESTFVAFHRLPVRHGMTVAELAKLFNAERGWRCQLTVITCEGWSRAQWFDQTGLPWTNPSPNMRSLTAATLYPGVCLLEACAVSVGRGTGTPFEIVGAPYVHDGEFAAALNRAGVPGVRFVPVRFTPDASVFKGQVCGGVQILLVNRDTLNAVDLGLTLIQTLHRLYPEKFNLDKVNNLLFHPPTIDALRAGRPLAEIKTAWAAELEAFSQRREAFLLYR
jgi:uncharacterized protein YbbC (DUF1343 family)